MPNVGYFNSAVFWADAVATFYLESLLCWLYSGILFRTRAKSSEEFPSLLPWIFFASSSLLGSGTFWSVGF